jgi:hypothetical protein
MSFHTDQPPAGAAAAELEGVGVLAAAGLDAAEAGVVGAVLVALVAAAGEAPPAAAGVVGAEADNGATGAGAEVSATD